MNICANCKHMRWAPKATPTCWHPNEVRGPTPVSGIYYSKTECQYKNRVGYCEDYEPTILRRIRVAVYGDRA